MVPKTNASTNSAIPARWAAVCHNVLKGSSAPCRRLSFPPDFSHPQYRRRAPLMRRPDGGQRATAGQRQSLGGKRQAAPHPPSPSRPGPPGASHASRLRKADNIYAAALTLYIAPAAAGLQALAPNQRWRASAPLPRHYPVIPHALARPPTRRSPKAHKMVTNYARIVAIGLIYRLALQ